MKKRTITLLLVLMLLLSSFSGGIAFAAETDPFTLATELTEEAAQADGVYASDTVDESALIVNTPDTVTLTKVCAFILCSVGAAIGGIMYTYKLKSSVPTIGDNLYMMAISSVALGGTLFSGGKGSALRTLVGVLTVTAISSGMNMAGVNPLWKNVVYGIVLIAAVAINSEKGGRDLIIK